jgi:DNA-directed RNA polymerase III subunit RPC11
MQFCPICSNLLLVEEAEAAFRFCCQTCPYISRINKKISKTMKLKRKEVDDVLGGEDAWAAANRTTAACPYCDNLEVSEYERGRSLGWCLFAYEYRGPSSPSLTLDTPIHILPLHTYDTTNRPSLCKCRFGLPMSP